MLTFGLILIVLGLAVVLGGRYAMWVFRDGRDQPPATISGGFLVGATWAVRLGVIAAAVGAVALTAGAII